MSELTRVAHVATDRGGRYAKQLSGHLGRRSQIRDTADGIVIELPVGSCLMTVRADELTLTATAQRQADLDVVTDVVGRHLERFGERDELTVAWQ